jgi:paraquat-inducible protein A
MTSAAASGLVSCHDCALVVRARSPSSPGHCPRCAAPLAFRKTRSIERTWALLIAAAILYAPANLLPVLTTYTLVSRDSDTIMSGVVYLWTSGSWPLSVIVLVASVIIPIGKILALGLVLASVQLRWNVSRRQRTRMYRIVEFIGRWSMLDVFVDTFVVALVQLSPLMSVDPGPGVVYFMAVVILTMFAAQSFDPRLIWDAARAPTLAPLAAPRGGRPTPRGGPSDLADGHRS